MQWNRIMLSHTTTIGIHRIVRLPGIQKEDFLQKLREEILPMASLPPLNRVTNVTAQTLSTDETEDSVDTCSWAIHFNGVHRPELVRDNCEAMYSSVRDKLEAVGVRTSFRLETLEASWDAEI